MTTQRRHRCGGTLAPRNVQIRDERDGVLFGFTVPGLVCDKCHAELVDRETATQIQGSQIPTVSLPRETASTRLDAITMTLPAPVGTQGVAA